MCQPRTGGGVGIVQSVDDVHEPSSSTQPASPECTQPSTVTRQTPGVHPLARRAMAADGRLRQRVKARQGDRASACAGLADGPGTCNALGDSATGSIPGPLRGCTAVDGHGARDGGHHGEDDDRGIFRGAHHPLQPRRFGRFRGLPHAPPLPGGPRHQRRPLHGLNRRADDALPGGAEAGRRRNGEDEDGADAVLLRLHRPQHRGDHRQRPLRP